MHAVLCLQAGLSPYAPAAYHSQIAPLNISTHPGPRMHSFGARFTTHTDECAPVPQETTLISGVYAVVPLLVKQLKTAAMALENVVGRGIRADASDLEAC